MTPDLSFHWKGARKDGDSNEKGRRKGKENEAQITSEES